MFHKGTKTGSPVRLYMVDKEWGNKQIGLVYKNGRNEWSSSCIPNSLELDLVRGKVVVCDIGRGVRGSVGAVFFQIYY